MSDIIAHQGFIPVRHNKSDGFFSVDFAAAGNYGNFLDARVIRDQVFHFNAVYFFTTAVDHVLAAIFDIQVVILIEAGYIAGVEPAVVEELLIGRWVLPVLAHDHWPFQP